MSSENDLVRAVGDFLTVKKVFWFRNNTGAFAGEYKGKTRFFRYGAKGSGDIFALHRGVFVSIECKSPGKVPTDAQVAWMKRVRHHGGMAQWIDNIDQFIAWWNVTFPS